MEFELLSKIIAEVMNVDPKELSMDTTFVDDLGADSLDLLQIIMKIEDTFNVVVPKDSLGGIITVEDALNLIKRL